MFVRHIILSLFVVVLLVAAALGGAKPSNGSGVARRYVVRSGDTLWGIAAEHYSGDLRAAIWRIQRRNELPGSALRPGKVLVLPP
jgi:nucleoid-associated protein YgaU